MFELGWDEMAIIAVVALVVLGPKELPNALRTVMSLTKAARKLAGEFQSGVNEIVREADLEDTKKKLTELQSINKNTIQKAVEKAIDPTGEIKTVMRIDKAPAINSGAPKLDLTANDPVVTAPSEAVALESKPAESPPAESPPVGSTRVESALAESIAAEPVPQKDPAA